MRKGYVLLLAGLMGVMLLLMALLHYMTGTQTTLLDRLSFTETVCGMSLELYHDETEDVYYLFLPSYVTAEQLNVTTSGGVGYRFSVDGADYGTDVRALSAGEEVAVTVEGRTKSESYTLQLCRCENLSTIYIQTESGSLSWVNANKENEEDAAVLFVDADGTVTYEGLATISGRGNTTWNKEKKPYNLKLNQALEEGAFAGITDLCLLANWFDDSKLRNAIAYYTAQEIGIEYASPYQLVDVYANGEYMGLYAVATKDVYEGSIAEDDICAVFETVISAEEGTFTTELGCIIETLYGEAELVQQVLSAFEQDLIDGNWAGVEKDIDVDSFVKDSFVGEYLLNFDFTWKSSHYYYIDSKGKIHAMCAWDFDLTLGRSTVYTYTNLYNMAEVYNRDIASWYKYLVQHQEYCDLLAQKAEDYEAADLYDELCAYVNQLAEQIEASWHCDLVRNDTVQDISLDEYVDEFLDLLQYRIGFIESYFSNPSAYCVIEFTNSDNIVIYKNICIPTGESLWEYLAEENILTLEKYGDFVGWYTEDDLSVYDVDTVTEDLTFYGTWNDDASTSSFASTLKNLITWPIRTYGYNITAAMGFMGLFSLLFLAVLGREARQWRKGRVVRK